MDYTLFNTEDSELLELEEGDCLQLNIVSESGKLSLEVQKDGETPIYRGSNLPTSSFQVIVPQSGAYKITAKGEHAKGSLSITKVAP